jgi:hypothetical protein
MQGPGCFSLHISDRDISVRESRELFLLPRVGGPPPSDPRESCAGLTIRFLASIAGRDDYSGEEPAFT